VKEKRKSKTLLKITPFLMMSMGWTKKIERKRKVKTYKK